jgi:hypothetical protein
MERELMRKGSRLANLQKQMTPFVRRAKGNEE